MADRAPDSPLEGIRDSLYIGDYFSDRIMAGDRPVYGYPPDGGLPEVPAGATMKIENTFMVALRKEREDG